MSEPTNRDLMDMLKSQNARLESIETMVQRATGMWILSKWVAGGVLTLLATWAAVRGWWQS